MAALLNVQKAVGCGSGKCRSRNISDLEEGTRERETILLPYKDNRLMQDAGGAKTEAFHQSYTLGKLHLAGRT